MRKIRIGKDISVRWPILTNGAPESLDGRDLKLLIKSQYNVAQEIVAFTTEENVVSFTFPGPEQQMLGTYKLTLWENYGKPGQTAVDCCEAFQLVSCTCEEEPGNEGLTAETVDLESSTIEIGIGGALSPDIVQEPGESTTAVMSQDAVTKAIAAEGQIRSAEDTKLSNKIDQTLGNINSLLETI